MNAVQPQHSKFTKHRISKETASAARRHLMSSPQEVENALIDVVINEGMKLFALLVFIFRAGAQIVSDALKMMQTISCPE